MDLSHLSDFLATIPMSTIAIVAAVLTVVRLGLARSDSEAARSIAEIMEALLIAGVLVFMLIQPLLMKTFFIPSPSMVPTLIENDHIICNKLDYRIEAPHREDIIVFVAPTRALLQAPEGYHPDQGPVDYIKRLIGVAGDVIAVHHGYVLINGEEKTHESLEAAFNVLDNTGHQHVKIEANDVAVYNGTSWTKYSAAQTAQALGAPGATIQFHPGETIRNGVVLNEPYTAEDPAYDMKIVDGKSILSYPDDGGVLRADGLEIASPEEYKRDLAAPPGPVPPGFVFAMGDNRNDSGDSTHWGPLEQNRLVGKATAVFWPVGRLRLLH